MNARVLITGARAPAALHIARLLHSAGVHVVMADSVRFPVGAASNACAHYLRLPAANGDAATYAKALKAALVVHDISFVIPTCEEVFHLARIWAGAEMPAKLFAPSFDQLRIAHNKFAFVEYAASLGLEVPHAQILRSAADVAALDGSAREMVLKPVWSRFAQRSLIRPSRVSITPTAADPWVAQAYVAGDELCSYAVAHAGRLVGLATYRPIYRAGRGAGIAFEPVEEPAVRRFVRRYVAATGWQGQISFDFIRRRDGHITAIECNPRATSGVHFFQSPDEFAKALLHADPAEPNVTVPLAVKAALALYGPFQRPFRVWRDLWRMRDVMAWPDDPRPRRTQLAATCEMAAIALRHGISLTAATTHDIAWNGD